LCMCQEHVISSGANVFVFRSLVAKRCIWANDNRKIWRVSPIQTSFNSIVLITKKEVRNRKKKGKGKFLYIWFQISRHILSYLAELRPAATLMRQLLCLYGPSSAAHPRAPIGRRAHCTLYRDII